MGLKWPKTKGQRHLHPPHPGYADATGWRPFASDLGNCWRCCWNLRSEVWCGRQKLGKSHGFHIMAGKTDGDFLSHGGTPNHPRHEGHFLVNPWWLGDPPNIRRPHKDGHLDTSQGFGTILGLISGFCMEIKGGGWFPAPSILTPLHQWRWEVWSFHQIPHASSWIHLQQYHWRSSDLLKRLMGDKIWTGSVFRAVCGPNSTCVFRLQPAASSTAEGGGGSFKNRKSIGGFVCCDAWLAERTQW